MSNIAFVLVPSYSKSNRLNARMWQITKSFLDITCKEIPIINVSNYDDLNNFKSHCEFLVVVTAGVVFSNSDHVYNKIKNIPDTVGLMGHLLQYEFDITPWMHEQFFIIRTDAFKEFNFFKGYRNSFKLIRSDKDLHDGHAPYEITLGDKKQLNCHQFGTSLIESCLLSNYRVINFDNDWRMVKSHSRLGDKIMPAKGFLYPKKHTKLFEKCLDTLTIDEGLDQSQKEFINSVNYITDYRTVNILQYEDSFSVDVDAVICPASGFLGELSTIKSNAKNLILYDVNHNNILLKKNLYTNWDGKNYLKWAKKFALDNNFNIEPYYEDDLLDAKKYYDEVYNTVFPIWQQFKNNVNVQFIIIDIIKNPEIIIQYIKPTTLLMTSSIFTIYPLSHILYDINQINDARKRIQQIIDETNSVFLE